MKKIRLFGLAIIFACGCATSGGLPVSLPFLPYLAEVQASLDDASTSQCAFTNRDEALDLIAPLKLVDKDMVKDWRFDYEGERKIGLDLYVRTSDNRDIYLTIELKNDRCASFVAHWLVE